MVAAVGAPFPATIATDLVRNADTVVMGTHEDGDTASEVVRVPRISIVYLPFVSASRARDNHTVVEAWRIVHPMCVTNR